jgi:hypothetical protein
MAASRTMKLKEYGTDILTHSNNSESDQKNVRFNNTFKSSILDGPDEQRNYPKSKDNLF